MVHQVCGKPVYRWPKIVSGENARLGQWPWQVLVHAAIISKKNHTMFRMT